MRDEGRAGAFFTPPLQRMRTPHYVFLVVLAAGAGAGWYFWNNAKSKEAIYETCRGAIIAAQEEDSVRLCSYLDPAFVFTLNNTNTTYAQLKDYGKRLLTDAKLEELDIRGIDIKLGDKSAIALASVHVKSGVMRVQSPHPWPLRMELILVGPDDKPEEQKWLITKAELTPEE